jgi:acetyltransferase-like isoleucine patch superfamily enzyme
VSTQVSSLPRPSRPVLALRRARLRRRGVTLAPDVVVGRGVHVEGGAWLVLEAGAVVGDGCRFHLAAPAVVGARAVLGPRCVVRCATSVTVGAGAVLGDEAVLDDGRDPDPDDVGRPVREQPPRSAALAVGAGARVGPGVVVRGGAQVAPGEVVLAHAVVA